MFFLCFDKSKLRFFLDYRELWSRLLPFILKNRSTGFHLLFFFFYLFFRQFYWEWKRKPVGQGEGFFGQPWFRSFPFPFNPRLFKNLGLSFFPGLRPVFLPLGALLFGFLTGNYPTNDGPEKENNTYYINIQSLHHPSSPKVFTSFCTGFYFLRSKNLNLKP